MLANADRPGIRVFGLFNDLVGCGEQRRRHRQTERLRSLEVDDEFKFGRLLDRQVGSVSAFEIRSR